MAALREITDPNEIAGIFGGAAPAEAAAEGASAPSIRGVREITDPAQIASIFGGGAASFADRFGTGPMASTLDTSTPEGAAFRRVADERLVGKPGPFNQAMAAVIRGTNTGVLNLPRAGGAAAATVLAPLLGKESRTFRQNLDLAAEQEEALARQFPKTALAGTGAGIVGGAVALPGLGGATTGFGRAAQGLATGAGYGAASEFIGTLDPAKTIAAGVIGGGVGAAAAPLTDFAIKGGRALWPMISRNLPVANAKGELTATARALLQREGVPAETLTPDVQARVVQVLGQKGESEGALREALAQEFGIPLSRGQATGEAASLELERAALAGDRGPRAQAVGQDFTRRQADAIGEARDRFAERAGRGVTLENPTQAAEVVADQAREYALRTQREAATGQQAATEALAGIRGPAPIDTLDAGAAVAQGLRERAAQSKAAYQSAYGDLAELPGEFHPSSFDGLGDRIRAKLGPDTPIDPMLTPASARALADMDKVQSILALPDGAGATTRQVEQFRKRLSALYPSTSQNPTDRRALSGIRAAFDDHMLGMAETGRFGARQAAQEAADGFPGASAIQAAPAGFSAAGGRPGEPETLTRYLARAGGVPLDDEARRADFHRLYVPGNGTLARRDAPSWDQIRVRLAEEGFLPPDIAGGASARDVADWARQAIHAERVEGRPTFRMGDEVRAGGGRAAERVADENADHAAMIDRQARRMTIDLEGYGYRPHDLDRGALDDAAGMMLRRETDDAAEAYDRAVARRAAEPAGAGASHPAADEVPFPELGEGVGPAASSALPIASPEAQRYGETARQARALFQAYKSDFAPRGAGDDVGLAMRRIVDRDAEPIEVARMLYSGSPGLNVRLADHAKRIVGENSETWARHQQGYLAKILNGRDTSPRAVSDRITAALSGEGRNLSFRVLTDRQVAGLRQFQAATRSAHAAGEVPEWITALGRSDFDPNRITGDLFGSGVPGARPGSAAYAGALKRFVGEDSAEWSGLRLAAWQRLVMKPDGSEMLPPRQLAARIQEFTTGRGSGLAKQMFEPEFLADLRRYGRAVQNTVMPDGTPRPNGGGSAGKVAGKALDAIATALGFHVGGFAGAGAAYTGRFGTKLIQGGINGRAARQSFEGGAPSFRSVGPVLDLSPVGVGSGLAAEYGIR